MALCAVCHHPAGCCKHTDMDNFEGSSSSSSPGGSLGAIEEEEAEERSVNSNSSMMSLQRQATQPLQSSFDEESQPMPMQQHKSHLDKLFLSVESHQHASAVFR